MYCLPCNEANEHLVSTATSIHTTVQELHALYNTLCDHLHSSKQASKQASRSKKSIAVQRQ